MTVSLLFSPETSPKRTLSCHPPRAHPTAWPTLRGGDSAQGHPALTELLDGPVCAPGQLQGHVHPALLVLHPSVCLEGDP